MADMEDVPAWVADVMSEERVRIRTTINSALASWSTDGRGAFLYSGEGSSAVVVAEHYIPPHETLDDQAEEMRDANLGDRSNSSCYHMIQLRGRTRWMRADAVHVSPNGSVMVEGWYFVTRDGWCRSWWSGNDDPGVYCVLRRSWGPSTWLPSAPPLRYSLRDVRLAGHHEIMRDEALARMATRGKT